MADLRILSYLPNPRIWKATIAARLCGVEIEVRGASPRELSTWLWDFDARPLSAAECEAAEGSATEARTGFAGRLHKTPAFLEAHPFGTVPAAFSPDGKIGIFESNSIMRAVARLGAERFPLYGPGPYSASRVDSFLDATLVFARDAQLYLLSLMRGEASPQAHARAKEAFVTWSEGIDRALAPDRAFLVGDDVTLADIAWVAEVCLFANERRSATLLKEARLEPILTLDTPLRAMRHFARLCRHPAFAPDVGPYLEALGVTPAG